MLVSEKGKGSATTCPLWIRKFDPSSLDDIPFPKTRHYIRLPYLSYSQASRIHVQSTGEPLQAA